jgi:4-hydroxy-tetrahydrodipicolinate synthase
MFSGCGTAIVTPFNADGSIDEQGLRDLVAFQEEQGIRLIIPCGSTGESATLDHEEHLKVIEIVMDQVTKAKVLAGTGSNATHEAIHLTRKAKDLGVDGVLSVSPYYNKPTPQGIVKHYEAIAQVDVPIIIYNIPGRTGSNINAATMVKLANIPSIAGVKEASGDLVQVMNILRNAPKDFVVMSGDDVMTFPMMCLGAKGVISVASNIIPDRMVKLVDLLAVGNLVEARRAHNHLMPLFSHLFIETNPIPVKTALRLMGKPAGSFRLPLCDMTPQNLETLKKTLTDLEILQ